MLFSIAVGRQRGANTTDDATDIFWLLGTPFSSNLILQCLRYPEAIALAASCRFFHFDVDVLFIRCHELQQRQVRMSKLIGVLRRRSEVLGRPWPYILRRDRVQLRNVCGRVAEDVPADP